MISLPSLDEPIVKHKNAYQAVQELQEIEGVGATFLSTIMLERITQVSIAHLQNFLIHSLPMTRMES